MPEIPGLEADVYFGDPQRALPDWRAETDDVDDEDNDEPTAEDKAEVAGILGFDPAELWPEEKAK